MPFAKTLLTIGMLLFLAGGAHAEKPDLMGATLIGRGMCDEDETSSPLRCMLVEKQGERYLLLFDHGNSLYLVYRIRKGAALPFHQIDRTLIWSADDETSRV